MIDLSAYGFGSEQNNNDDTRLPARVTAVHRERYELICRHGTAYARLKAAVYLSGRAEPAYPTTGDFVTIWFNPLGDSLIVDTRDRKSCFSRREPGPSGGEQAVAANFDYVFILTSLNRDFNPKRLERYLTAAWQSGAQPVVVLTKADLMADFAEEYLSACHVAAGAQVFAVSALTGFGMEGLRAFLRPGATIAFLGSSGVGKSSLINALAGEQIMAVSAVREDDDRGRHTTTHRQLILLGCGATVIDTPGMRELGMWDVGVGIHEAFSDVEELAALCRFSDCAHASEPGCAIRAAIERGELDEARLVSYQKLRHEAKYDDDRAAFMRDKQQRNKNIAKLSRARKAGKR